MSDELITRLRRMCDRNNRHKYSIGDYWNAVEEAADALERVTRERDDYRDDYFRRHKDTCDHLARAQAAEAEAERLRADAARLDWLERMANEPKGILLHGEKESTGRCGLGLANTGRTLRQAIDDARGLDAALEPKCE
jgi:hypothetical protein